MKEIRLPRGKVALVDDEDYELLGQRRWCCGKEGYAQRKDNNTIIRMHRIIMNTPDGMLTDHINQNKLDNQKNNLRICTYAENLMNSSKRKHTTSIYKGVSYNKQRKKWEAYIKFNKKQIHLGNFNYEKEAAKKYDEKAKELFGEFARLNFGEN